MPPVAAPPARAPAPLAASITNSSSSTSSTSSTSRTAARSRRKLSPYICSHPHSDTGRRAELSGTGAMRSRAPVRSVRFHRFRDDPSSRLSRQSHCTSETPQVKRHNGSSTQSRVVSLVHCDCLVTFPRRVPPIAVFTCFLDSGASLRRVLSSPFACASQQCAAIPTLAPTLSPATTNLLFRWPQYWAIR